MNAPLILPLDRDDYELDQVGGKARSLARMVSAGLPVPPGFLIGTEAYRRFVNDNHLTEAVSQAASGTPDSAALSDLRLRFESTGLPGDIVDQIEQAYQALGEPPVAVRSSATAEDLPDLSFAGQQDTCLNVRGFEELISAVRRCWASLWSPRAVDYRTRMGVGSEAVAMGVVVQVMVESEVSGVLFTANPSSGDRSEMVINASYGLGEAIVGGLVTPDALVVDRTSGRVKQSTVGDKSEKVVYGDGSGISTQNVLPGEQQVLSVDSAAIDDLVDLARRTEAMFEHVPQDIEWAVSEGTAWLLQSRPVTNLPDAPLDVRWESPTPGQNLVRRQVVENMPDPLSPLFDELYLELGLERSMDTMVETMGLPVDIGDFIERPLFVSVNGYAYCRATYRMNWRKFPRVLLWYITKAPFMLKTLLPHWREVGLPEYLATVNRWKEADPAVVDSEQLLEGIRQLAVADATYWFEATIAIAHAKVTDGALNYFLGTRLVPGELTSGVFLRGYSTIMLEAQEELEKLASEITASDILSEIVAETDPGGLLHALGDHPEGESVANGISDYLRRYGHQIYSLDFVEPTMGEDPVPVLRNLKELVGSVADAVERRRSLCEERDRQIEATETMLGPVRRWLFKKLLGWARSAGPGRDEALFYVGAGWPRLRELALELGSRLVRADRLTSPEDLYYLRTEELTAAIEGTQDSSGLKELVADRQALRKARMRLHPPPMVPEGSRLKIGFIDLSVFETQKRNRNDAHVLEGFPVSPGKVTGVASVVLNIGDFENMQPDTILVCPTTTPAWTPLFSQAKGLVTDIGGILAHGSIVAREYGIPAVMGTGSITQRIVSGQRIAVDGDAGTVEILD